MKRMISHKVVNALDFLRMLGSGGSSSGSRVRSASIGRRVAHGGKPVLPPQTSWAPSHPFARVSRPTYHAGRTPCLGGPPQRDAGGGLDSRAATGRRKREPLLPRLASPLCWSRTECTRSDDAG